MVQRSCNSWYGNIFQPGWLASNLPYKLPYLNCQPNVGIYSKSINHIKKPWVSSTTTRSHAPVPIKGSLDLGPEDWRPTSGGEYLDELGESLRTRVVLTCKGTTLSECAEGTCCLAAKLKRLRKVYGKVRKWERYCDDAGDDDDVDDEEEADDDDDND